MYLADRKTAPHPETKSNTTDTVDATKPAGLDWHRAIKNIVRAYGMKRIRMVFVTNFLFQGGLALFATFFAVFLTSEFGFNQVSVGYYIAYAGVWVIISQGLVLRWLTRRYEEVTLLRVFLFLGAGSVFLYYITNHTIGLLIVGACFALTNGIAMATLPSLASRRAEDKHQGEIMGINTSVQALAQAVPPILAGFLASQITPSAPVYVAGAVIGAGWLVFIFTVKKE
jgi:predicted MFS family arabinose efflux permease